MEGIAFFEKSATMPALASHRGGEFLNAPASSQGQVEDGRLGRHRNIHDRAADFAPSAALSQRRGQD